MSRRVRDIMSQHIITISPDAALSDAYALLRHKKISMLVVEQAGKAVGVITERDAVRLIHDNLDSNSTLVADVMSSPVVTVKGGLSLFKAYDILSRNHFRHLVVADKDGLLAGVVTLTDMLGGMGIEYFVDLKQVSTIMTTHLTRVRPDDSLRLVIDLMHRHRISCVVVAEQWKPVGIITERDIVKYYEQGVNVDEVAVSAVMSSPVRSMLDSAYIPEANKIMQDERLRHMVIVDQQGRLSGLISQTDLTACMEAGYISYLKGVIEHREKKLSRISHEHAAFLKDNPNAVIAFDPSGNITNANAIAIQLLGNDLDSLRQTNVQALVADHDKDRFASLLQQLCRGKPVHAELQIQCMSECIADTFNSFLPVKSAGEVSGIYVVMHDISCQKQAERRLQQSEQRFQALAELSRAMPWSLDLTNGCFSYVGNQIEQQLGYPADSWINMATWAARMHADDRASAR